MNESYASIWEAIADRVPARPAVIYGSLERSFGEFEQRAARLAGALASLGVRESSRVAIDLWNCPENLETIFAAFKLRAVPFNLNYRYRESEIAHILQDSEAEVVIFDASLGERIDKAIAQSGRPLAMIEVGAVGSGVPGAIGYEDLVATSTPAPRVARSGDDEVIIYTGGTTGYPKGVVWAQSALGPPRRLPDGSEPSSLDAYVDALVTQDAPAPSLVVPPLMHATGFVSASSALTSGAAVVFCESRSFDAHEVLSLIDRHSVRTFTIIGDAFAKPLLEELDAAADAGRPYSLASLQSIGNTGVIWSAPLKRGILAYGDFEIRDGVSSTEGAGFATSVTRAGDDIETAKFRLGPNSRVIGENGRDVVPGSGEIGYLAMTGALPKRYLNDPDATARTWPTIDGVRYSMPGDMAMIEEDGTVVLLGRGSEVVNTGGEKVFVEEVEQAILTHPGVRDCLVVGLPDERWGTRVTAVVKAVAGTELTEREIIDHVGAQLADHKRPRQVVFCQEIPRSPTGKADRRRAREIALAASSGS